MVVHPATIFRLLISTLRYFWGNAVKTRVVHLFLGIMFLIESPLLMMRDFGHGTSFNIVNTIRRVLDFASQVQPDRIRGCGLDLSKRPLQGPYSGSNLLSHGSSVLTDFGKQ